MQEIFNLVKRELDEVGPRDLTPAGVVLTGGASLLEGAEELASEVIGLPVRLGEPDYVNGLTDVIDNPVYVKKGKQVPKAIFSTAVGLVEYGLKYDQPSRDNNRGEIVSDFFGKLKNWFNVFFSRKGGTTRCLISEQK